MIFRVAVCVLKSEPEPFPSMTDGHREGTPWFDAYKVVLGVNAPDISEAVSRMTTALANAADEDGRHLGGVVLEAHAVSVTASEFKGYEKYFLQPLDRPGIFYVSGRTHFAIARPHLAGAMEAVLAMKESREESDIPSPPSFVFRRLREEVRPRMCRLLCPVCGAWKEHDSTNLMYSFFDGLDELDEEKYRLGREAAASMSPFVERHLQCLIDAGPSVASKGLLFLYEGDEGFDDLDPSKENRD